MMREAIKGGNHLEQLVARVERDEQGVQIWRLRAPSMRRTCRYGQHAAYQRRSTRAHSSAVMVDVVVVDVLHGHLDARAAEHGAIGDTPEIWTCEIGEIGHQRPSEAIRGNHHRTCGIGDRTVERRRG